MFSIIYELVHGIIYKNSKKEKRVMRHSEIHKFCDATLNRVLEGLKSYNNDVKYGYIKRDLTEDEVEYLKFFEEEIEVRLKYHNQMRRWEINKSKEIAKPVTPPSESSSDKDSDPEQAQRDKDMQKNLALIAKETVGMPLSAEQGDWLADTDEEPDEQELEAYYMYMEKIPEVSTAHFGPTYDTNPLEKVHSNDHYNVFATDIQHYEQPESIHDTYVVETVDSNGTLDSLDMCDNEGQADQNAEEAEDVCFLLL
ncbi:hypothetical protein Tco_0647169 [Tanacetum coccineum]